ncbi:hypothetical protein LEP1GSC036_2225 [Leptospira weilii str. 2006001853]|uniref:Uncharacterized protein n=1 Tax=Leptospira weilii str. 2006001853 TaxID=1001589 RepID=A0A828YVD5_9LEPT|nr:hypothetical protein LEP1GSC036_2225 [Leptospira weilii str. 2006001853]
MHNNGLKDFGLTRRILFVFKKPGKKPGKESDLELLPKKKKSTENGTCASPKMPPFEKTSCLNL